MQPSDAGRFVHRDLMSTDPAASSRFFEALFGWEPETAEPAGPESRHVRLRKDGRMQCALMSFDASYGIPSHFVPYVASEDVDAACERAKAGGGSVCAGPMDLGDAGRWALINDAGGGLITAFRANHDHEPEIEGHPPAGHFCFEELLTDDPERESAFYTQVFGWGAQSFDVDGKPYGMFTNGEKQRAGVLKKPAEAEGPTTWMSYVYVDDVDASAARALELGGKQYVEPRDITGIGRFAVLADPTGAMFAIYRGLDG